MEFVFELILDLILESSIEASKSSKIPKPIRYLLMLFISLFYLSVIGLIIWMGIDSTKNNLVGGIMIILFGVLFLILSIIKFRRVYIDKKSEQI